MGLDRIIEIVKNKYPGWSINYCIDFPEEGIYYFSVLPPKFDNTMTSCQFGVYKDSGKFMWAMPMMLPNFEEHFKNNKINIED